MLTSTSRLRRPGAVALLGSAFLIGAVGCGDDDDKTQSAQSSAGAVVAGPVVERGTDPYELNCSHLANRDNFPAVHDAALTLAKQVRVGDGSPGQVATRLNGAMRDLCERRDDPAYRPAGDSVEAVQRGGYKNTTSLP